MANPPGAQPSPIPRDDDVDPSDHMTQEEDLDALAEAEAQWAQEQYEDAIARGFDASDLEGDDDDSSYDPTANMTQAELDDLAEEAQLSQEAYEADLVREALS